MCFSLTCTFKAAVLIVWALVYITRRMTKSVWSSPFDLAKDRFKCGVNSNRFLQIVSENYGELICNPICELVERGACWQFRALSDKGKSGWGEIVIQVSKSSMFMRFFVFAFVIRKVAVQIWKTLPQSPHLVLTNASPCGPPASSRPWTANERRKQSKRVRNVRFRQSKPWNTEFTLFRDKCERA